LVLATLVLVTCVLASPRANAQANDLINAAGKGDLPRVKALLDAGSDVNARLSDGHTALIAASENGRLEVVRLLLDAKADVNARLGGGQTALFMASWRGHLEVVHALLDAKADANVKTDSGKTALIAAAQWGRTDVVRMLIEAKADVNAKRDDGTTALMAASENGHQEVVQALLGAGAVRAQVPTPTYPPPVPVASVPDALAQPGCELTPSQAASPVTPPPAAPAPVTPDKHKHGRAGAGAAVGYVKYVDDIFAGLNFRYNVTFDHGQETDSNLQGQTTLTGEHHWGDTVWGPGASFALVCGHLVIVNGTGTKFQPGTNKSCFVSADATGKQTVSGCTP
jgi:ankyrin repeat protein